MLQLFDLLFDIFYWIVDPLVDLYRAFKKK